jgi:hypothetical protein
MSCRYSAQPISCRQRAVQPVRELPNPEMIDRYLHTLIRVSGPRVFALMGAVRPGTWVFGGDSAGGRAP